MDLPGVDKSLLIGVGTALDVHQVSVKPRHNVIVHRSVRVLCQVYVAPLGVLARWHGFLNVRIYLELVMVHSFFVFRAALSRDESAIIARLLP